MVLAMTVQVASARKDTQALKIQQPIIGRRNNASVKINQVGIVCAVSLGRTDAMRIMAGIAWGLDIADMLFMRAKGFII